MADDFNAQDWALGQLGSADQRQQDLITRLLQAGAQYGIGPQAGVAPNALAAQLRRAQGQALEQPQAGAGGNAMLGAQGGIPAVGQMRPPTLQSLLDMAMHGYNQMLQNRSLVPLGGWTGFNPAAAAQYYTQGMGMYGVGQPGQVMGQGMMGNGDMSNYG